MVEKKADHWAAQKADVKAVMWVECLVGWMAGHWGAMKVVL